MATVKLNLIENVHVDTPDDVMKPQEHNSIGEVVMYHIIHRHLYHRKFRHWTIFVFRFERGLKIFWWLINHSPSDKCTPSPRWMVVPIPTIITFHADFKSPFVDLVSMNTWSDRTFSWVNHLMNFPQIPSQSQCSYHTFRQVISNDFLLSSQLPNRYVM